MKSLILFQKLGILGKRSSYILVSLVIPLSTAVSVYATPFFTEYPISTGYQSPSKIVSAGGVVAYLNKLTGTNDLRVLSTMTTSGVVTDYNLLRTGDTRGVFNHLTVDNSGNVWFVGCAGTSSTNLDTVFGYVNPATSTLTTYTYAHTSSGCGNLGWSIAGLTIDAGGNPWVLLNKGGTHWSSVLSFTSTGSYRTSWGPTGSVYNWDSITAGPNNSLWITDKDSSHAKNIRQLTLDSTTYTVTGMNTITPPSGVEPGNLAPGPDGNLWFPDENSQNIYKMTPSGGFTAHAVAYGSPNTVTAGPDGAMWFTANTSSLGYIGRLTTGGTMNEYVAPGRNTTITAGPDNALWFIDVVSGKIVRLGY